MCHIVINSPNQLPCSRPSTQHWRYDDNNKDDDNRDGEEEEENAKSHGKKTTTWKMGS